jgi:uncharacterized protein (DUF58 family)
MTASAPTAWRRRWRTWIDARAPRQDRLTLTQRTVYILPSKGGLGYALVVLILLLAAINEQLNLAYALAFLLGGVGLSAMWLTHANLRGLTLSLGSIASVHAGQSLSMPVVLDASALPRGRYGLTLRAVGEADESLPADVSGEVAQGRQSTVHVALAARQRGWLELPRLRIDTTYPLGLFRAWAYWRARQRVLIWPALDPHAPPLPDSSVDGGSRAAAAAQPVDVPDGLRPWRRGDTLRSVAWKKSATRLASGLPPVSREASSRPHQECWVEWEQAPGLPLEARLSRLASWVVMAEQRALDLGQPYGLRMPNLTLGPAQGPQHLQQCLDTLATWGTTAPGEEGS